MAPDLMDDVWIYGGRLEQIHQTLVEGRPNGMPAWGQLPEPERRQLVAFVKTLPSGASAVAPVASSAAVPFNAPPPTPPFTDFRYESPGTIRKVTVADLPSSFPPPANHHPPSGAYEPSGRALTESTPEFHSCAMPRATAG